MGLYLINQDLIWFDWIMKSKLINIILTHPCGLGYQQKRKVILDVENAKMFSMKDYETASFLLNNLHWWIEHNKTRDIY